MTIKQVENEITRISFFKEAKHYITRKECFESLCERYVLAMSKGEVESPVEIARMIVIAQSRR